MIPFTRRLHWFRTGGSKGPSAPSVQLSVGRRIPAWALRVAAGGAALLTLPLLQSQAAGTIVTVAIVGALLLRPAGFAPVMLTLFAAVWVLTMEPFPIEVFPLLFVLHLVVMLCGLAGQVSWSGHVDLVAFATQWKRFWLVQALAQSLAVVAWWMTSIGFAAVSIQLLGALALAILTWMVIRRRSSAF